MKTKKLKPPTLRQRKFVAGVLKGKTIKNAAEDAGYSPGPKGDAARVNGSRALRKANVNALMQEALRRAGLSDEALAAKIKDLLEARRPHGQEGMIMVPDCRVQLGAVDLALKVTGGYAPQKAEVAGADGEALIPRGDRVIKFSPEDRAAIDKLLRGPSGKGG